MKFDFGPSGVSSLLWRWGIIKSKKSKKKIPKRKPTEAGIQEMFPFYSAIEIEGRSNDQTEAAIITPEAKPNKVFCRWELISFLIKKTKAEPITVPSKGINKT